MDLSRKVANTIGQILVPEKVRRYVSFRNATIAVGALFLANLAVMKGMGSRASQLPTEAAERYRKQLTFYHSPVFVTLDIVFVAVGFWAIWHFRKRKEYYVPCVIFYAMLLGNLLGLLLSWLVATP